MAAGRASVPEPCDSFEYSLTPGAADSECARSRKERDRAESSRVESRVSSNTATRTGTCHSPVEHEFYCDRLADCDHVPPCCVRRSLDRRRLASSSSRRQLARSSARTVERWCTWRQRRRQQRQRSSRSGPRSASEPEYRSTSSSSSSQRHRRPPRPGARRQRARRRHGQSSRRSGRDRSGRRDLLHLRRGSRPVLVRRRVQPPHLPHVLDPPPRPLQEERVHFLQGRSAQRTRARIHTS